MLTEQLRRSIHPQCGAVAAVGPRWGVVKNKIHIYIKMKAFLAVLVIAFVASTYALNDEQKAKFKVHKDECIAETKVDVEMLKKTKTGVFSDDEKLKEFLFCLGKKTGMLNDAGEYQMETIKKHLVGAYGEEISEKLIKACTEKNFPTGQEAAFHITKCHYELYPEHFKHKFD